MKYSRRQFLGTAAAGMGAMLLNGCDSGPKYFDPYEIVELGNTGIKTTLLSMGTGIRGGTAVRNLGDEQAVKLIREVYERGVRFFDTADSYKTHGLVSEALKIYPRSDYVIFTKMTPQRRPTEEGVRHGAEAEAAVMRYLEELKTDYIDGLLLHGWGFSGNWNTEHSEYMTVFEKMKERGIIRAHGLSSHSLDAVKTAVNESWVDTMHVRFNKYGVNMDDATEKVEPVVKQLHQEGKGVIAMKVYGEGAFSNSEELRDGTLRFVLQSGIVDVLTIGMDKISDIEDTESRIRKVAK
jgi:aryl-alcohol dehydrogenase-like predicted oxidoreductase